MKNLASLLLLLSLTTLSLTTFAQRKKAKAAACDKEMACCQKKADEKLLRHAVLFKFKDSATPEQVRIIEEAFAALPSKIKEIHSYEWGTNNSPENLNQGFTHCFFVTFKSEADRATYLPHPAHQAFVEILKPSLDKVLVIDYWTGK